MASTSRRQRNDILPLLELSYIPVDHLQPAPRKVRKLDPAHVREVAASISALGFCVPLLVDRENELINGEASYEAARLLGLDQIPCICIEHLTKNEQRVLRLAVNRLAERGQWDLDALKIEFEDLIVTEAPIEAVSRQPKSTRSLLATLRRGWSRGRSNRRHLPCRSQSSVTCSSWGRTA